jgi:hypothetical protein
MVDIDEILATAIRNVWLHADIPGSRSRYYAEIGSARRMRAAIEQEGLIIHHRPMATVSARSNGTGKYRPQTDD